VSTSDTVVSLATFVSGPFELEENVRTCEMIRDVLGVGFDLTQGEVLEAGANIGTGTLTFITALGAQRVHAFEPAPDNMRLLRQTVAANGLEDRVVTSQVALSNALGSVAFELSPQAWGDHRVRVEGQRGADEFGESLREVIEIPAVTIDSLVADGTIDLGKIQVAWIDIQGHEGALLEGARALLETDIPVVVEFWPYGLKRANGLDKFLALVQDHYSHVLNMHDAQLATNGQSTKQLLQPTSALATISERYPGRNDLTNLALLSLD